jgi:hypothetical protein
MMMNARNVNESGFRWTTSVKTATLIVVVGTLAAVWHPLRHSEVAEVVSTAAAQAAANAAPDMSIYFPSRFAAPEVIEPQAPTF